ncbi:DUF4192 domain-containing protein [Modestobacter lapidis]|nr:DUF4192 domain-containing protein [Modestobacter lapidis]
MPVPPSPAPVRLGALGDLVAALPHLIGFRPEESLLAVSLRGRDRSRVGLTARVDLPPAGAEDTVLGMFVRSVLTDHPRQVVLAVVSEHADRLARPVRARLPDGAPVAELPHRDLVAGAVRRFGEAGVPVRDVVLVRRGRWWSYDCTEGCCAPGAGTAVPGGTSALAVASALTGQVVEDGRDALARRISPVGFLAAAGMAQACADVGREVADRTGVLGPDVVAEESWAAIRAAVDRVSPGSVGTLPDRDVARVAWGLRDLEVRDLAMGLALGASAAGAEVLWTEVTRRVPPPLDAAPATLLAVTAWVRGDGAMANVALDRALDSEPGYSLALLLRSALDACFRPAEVRRLIRSCLSDLPDRDDPVGVGDLFGAGGRDAPG